MADTIAFMNEFISRIGKLSGIDRIQFFGSILEPMRFRPGKSDLDLLIYGNPSAETKWIIRKTIIELSDKYSLFIDRGPYMHPTPFYITNVVGDTMFKNFVLNMPFFLAKWRKAEKASPRLTVGERWSGIEHPSPLVKLAETLWG